MAIEIVDFPIKNGDNLGLDLKMLGIPPMK